MSGAAPPASWPIAAKAESLPATLPGVIEGLWLGLRDLRCARFRWTGADWSGSWVVP